MKNRHVENLRRKMRQFHRHHQWGLDGGLYIPHAYLEADKHKLSWWDDVGFILNGRRVIVNWRHPRCEYNDAIKSQAMTGIPALGVWKPEPPRKHWRKRGRSRKKLVYLEMRPVSDERAAYYDAVFAREHQLMREGIDLEIHPSMRVGVSRWATVVDLVAPIEIRSQNEIRALAVLAKRLLKRETTVAEQWPGYIYGREDWLSEANARALADPSPDEHSRRL